MRIDSLIVLRIGGRMLDIRRERHLSGSSERLFYGLGSIELDEAHPIGFGRHNASRQALVEMHGGARTQLASRPAHDFPAIGSCRSNEKKFHATTRVKPAAQSSGDDPALIGYEDIAGSQILYKIQEPGIDQRSGGAIHDQKPG